MIEFDPHINAENSTLLLVGCGGTGSALATIVGRTLYHMKANRMGIPRDVFLIDDDMVEMKNVGRQGFVAADAGQYKAEVLARRLSLGFGLKIQYHCEKFDAAMSPERGSNIILGAVDNHQARQDISQVKSIWIDAGNHKSAGQVVIGNTADASEVGYSIASFDAKRSSSIKYLPNAALVFPALLEAEKVERELSCAELLELNQQHLLINQQMALVAGQYLYKLLMREPIRSHYTYIDLDFLTMRSEMITLEHLKQFASKDAEVA
jgi:PRTRC genetic system ThiF family protein